MVSQPINRRAIRISLLSLGGCLVIVAGAIDGHYCTAWGGRRFGACAILLVEVVSTPKILLCVWVEKESC